MTDRIADTLAWAVDGARTATGPREALEQLCARLFGCGLPLERVAVMAKFLHPELVGWRFLWRPGTPGEVVESAYDLLATDDYRTSPVERLYIDPTPIRRRLERADCPSDFPVLAELRAEGLTDYLIQPLIHTDGRCDAVSWTTRRPGGFGDDDIADLEAIRGPLARLVEIFALRRTASNLLDAYVGPAAGRRILDGQIRRSDTQAIDAAILLADLRGFTRMANEEAGPDLIGLLNGFFDCLVPAIQAHGGEVLKFMGDGLLAIAPVSHLDGGGPAASCRAVLSAVRQAQKDLAAYNDGLEAAGRPRLRFGVGLHIGEVVYGNIGAAGRLDFTAIGPSVNLAARLQGLARDLDRDLVASAAFAAWCGETLAPLGRHRLSGFDAAEEVFGSPGGGEVA